MELKYNIRNKLPSQYQKFLNIFFKNKFDILANYRPKYNHKIKLNAPNDLKYYSLYNQLLKKLKVTKKYLTSHLNKKFIISSLVIFAFPILFVKKINRKFLRFCVDYRKLNVLIKKDRYLLPLIDEILTRIEKAKIFIRLDIK